MTQERRRYGFVLERQSSLAKHKMAFYEKQQALVAKYLDNWTEIAKSREQIPESVENMFTTNLTVRLHFRSMRSCRAECFTTRHSSDLSILSN